MVAYHSALVFGVLGVAGQGENDVPLQLPEDVEQPLFDLLDTYQNLTVRNVLEGYHDASQSLDMAMNLFAGGYLLKARKRIYTLTPVRPRWRRRGTVVGGLIEPTTRQSSNPRSGGLPG